MILRIIAFATLICLGFGTFGLANQVSLLPENTLALSSDRSANLDLFIAERHRPMIWGFAIGLTGFGVALVTKDKETAGWGLALGIIGFLWMELQRMELQPTRSLE